LAIVWKLRRVLHALDQQQAIELLLDKMKQTKSNAEFLMQIAKTTRAGTTTDRCACRPVRRPGGARTERYDDCRYGGRAVRRLTGTTTDRYGAERC